MLPSSNCGDNSVQPKYYLQIALANFKIFRSATWNYGRANLKQRACRVLDLELYQSMHGCRAKRVITFNLLWIILHKEFNPISPHFYDWMDSHRWKHSLRLLSQHFRLNPPNSFLVPSLEVGTHQYIKKITATKLAISIMCNAKAYEAQVFVCSKLKVYICNVTNG